MALAKAIAGKAGQLLKDGLGRIAVDTLPFRAVEEAHAHGRHCLVRPAAR